MIRTRGRPARTASQRLGDLIAREWGPVPFGFGVESRSKSAWVGVSGVSSIEGILEGVPSIFRGEAGRALMQDSLNGILLSGFCPGHEIPWSQFGMRDFFDFIIEKLAFCRAGNLAEGNPLLFRTARSFVVLPCRCAGRIPPTLRPRGEEA